MFLEDISSPIAF